MFGPYRLLRWLAEANWLHERGFDPRQPASALRKALAAQGESRSSAQRAGRVASGQLVVNVHSSILW
jgi:hypothetical protein